MLDQYIYELQDYLENPTLLANKTAPAILSKKALEDIDDINITPINHIKKFKEVDISLIHLSNVYYAKYSNMYSVETYFDW